MKAVLYIRVACADQLIDTHQPEKPERHVKDNGYEVAARSEAMLTEARSPKS